MEKIFRIKGSFRKSNSKLNFTKEIKASSESRAVEIIYSDLGSRHRVKRNMITLDEVEEIEPQEAEDQKISSLAEED